jgi:hypothetical protein
VCTTHRVPGNPVLRGGDSLDDETEERPDAALWRYSELVATLIEAELDDFVRHTRS